MKEKITCRRCGREIEKRGQCLHCQREEVNERASVQWRELSAMDLVRKDVELENKYKNVG